MTDLEDTIPTRVRPLSPFWLRFDNAVVELRNSIETRLGHDRQLVRDLLPLVLALFMLHVATASGVFLAWAASVNAPVTIDVDHAD